MAGLEAEEEVGAGEQNLQISLLGQIFKKTLEEKSVTDIFSNDAVELLAKWTQTKKLDAQELTAILTMAEEDHEAPAS